MAPRAHGAGSRAKPKEKLNRAWNHYKDSHRAWRVVGASMVAAILFAVLLFVATAVRNTWILPAEIRNVQEQIMEAEKRSEERFDNMLRRFDAERKQSDELLAADRKRSDERFDAAQKRSDERFENIQKWLGDTRAESKESRRLLLETRDSTRENHRRLENLEKANNRID